MHHPTTTLNWLLSTLVLLLSLSFINCAVAATLIGRVIGVVDGDTVDVLDSKKVTHRIRFTVNLFSLK